MNGTHKLDCKIGLGWKDLPGTNTNLLDPFVSYEENKVLWILPRCKHGSSRSGASPVKHFGVNINEFQKSLMGSIPEASGPTKLFCVN